MVCPALLVESCAIRQGRFQRVRNWGYYSGARSDGSVNRCYIGADIRSPLESLVPGSVLQSVVT